MPETLSPKATLPYPLPGVQQSSAASGTIHYIGMPCRAVAGKVRVAERVLLKEDSHASIHPSLSHIARRSVRP